MAIYVSKKIILRGELKKMASLRCELIPDFIQLWNKMYTKLLKGFFWGGLRDQLDYHGSQ